MELCFPADPYDIGNFVENVPRSQIHVLLKKCWKPKPNHKFPYIQQGSKRRRFQHKHLEQFDWLAYSAVPEKEGGFCKICVLFSRRWGGRGSQDLGTLVTKPLNKFKDATEVYSTHQRQAHHLFALEQATRLMSAAATDSPNVAEMLQWQSSSERNRAKQQKERERTALESIADTVLMCGRQNLPLRGHRDAGRVNLDVDTEPEEGNFKALLRFRVQSGDDNLAEWIRRAPGNALHTSAETQNEMVSICGRLVATCITERVRKAGIFSIIADETTDIATKQQLALCVRYVDEPEVSNGSAASPVVREDVVGLINPTQTTGKHLAEAIVRKLRDLSLDINLLRGQGYDGGSNMSGAIKGVQSELKAIQPLALYTHCAAHRLNLALMKASDMPAMRNLLGTIQNVCSFFSRSAGRTALLDRAAEAECPGARARKLKPLCQTRWVERHDTVLVFWDLLPAVVVALQEAADASTDAKVVSAANGMISCIASFEFIVTLAACVATYGVTLPLSRHLQAPNMGISEAFDRIKETQDAIARLRGSFDSEVMDVAMRRSEEMDVEVRVPRIVGRQRHRANAPADGPRDHYRRNMWIPLVDGLSSQLRERFPPSATVVTLETLLPSKVHDMQIEEVVALATTYEGDLPSVTCLRGELACWKARWEKVSLEKRPGTALAALQESQCLPNIGALLRLLCTLPITACEAERTFSALARIKDKFRSTMGEERAEGLLLVHVHKSVHVTKQQVVDGYLAGNRRVIR